MEVEGHKHGTYSNREWRRWSEWSSSLHSSLMHMLIVYTHLNSTYAHTSTVTTRGHSQLSSLRVHTWCNQSMHLRPSSVFGRCSRASQPGMNLGSLENHSTASSTNIKRTSTSACLHEGGGVRQWVIGGVVHYFLLHVRTSCSWCRARQRAYTVHM